MSTVKMYCYVVMSEPRDPLDPVYETTIHCVYLSEQMAEHACMKMNASDRFNSYDYYEKELQK